MSEESASDIDRSHAPRGNAANDAPRRWDAEHSARHPTWSIGTIKTSGHLGPVGVSLLTNAVRHSPSMYLTHLMPLRVNVPTAVQRFFPVSFMNAARSLAQHRAFLAPLRIVCHGADDLISWRCWHSGLEFLMSDFSPTRVQDP